MLSHTDEPATAPIATEPSAAKAVDATEVALGSTIEVSDIPASILLGDDLPSEYEEEDAEYVPLEGEDPAADETLKAGNETLAEARVYTEDEDDVDIDIEDSTDIPHDEIADLVMDSIPLRVTVLRHGKVLDAAHRHGILHQDFESDDEHDADYIDDQEDDGDDDDDEDDEDEDDEDETETDDIEVEEVQDNINHFEYATALKPTELHNPAKVLRDGKEIRVDYNTDVNSLAAQIQALMHKDDSTSDAMVM